MAKNTSETIGCDLGDKASEICVRFSACDSARVSRGKGTLSSESGAVARMDRPSW
jgi:hypothetical protein